MGRWKANNDGSAYYDANDEGPNQVAPPGQTGGTGDGQGNPTPEAPQHGWGPIKISGTYTPHPGSPGDFWHHIGDMHNGQPPAQGGDANGPGGGWGNGGMPPGSEPGGFTGRGPGGLPPWFHDFPPYGMPTGNGPLLQQLQNSNQANPNAPTPNAGETPQQMFQRFQNDYHAPDRDQVLGTMADSNYYGTMMHPMDRGGMSSEIPKGSIYDQWMQGGQQGSLKDFMGQNGWNTPPVPGLIGGNPNLAPHNSGGVLRGALGGMFGGVGGGSTNLLQLLLARARQGQQGPQ